jgi:hypothetical protein
MRLEIARKGLRKSHGQSWSKIFGDRSVNFENPAPSDAQSLWSVVAVFSVAALALMATESAIDAWVLGGLPTNIAVLGARFGELLLIPAMGIVGYVARSLRPDLRLLTLVAGYALVYLMMTQSRGNWIWPGTFDSFRSSSEPWVRPFLLGSALGLGLSFVKPMKPMSEALAGRYLILGVTALILSGLVPRLPSVESQFASTRWMFVAFVVFGNLALMYGARKELQT